MKRWFQGAAFLLMAAQVSGAQLEANLSPQDAKIGDRLTLDLKVTGASPRSVQFPLPDAENFTLLGIDSSLRTQEAHLKYTLAVYDTAGRYLLPEMPVVVMVGAAPETLFTPQLSVTIRSVAPDTAAAVLPLKPYREHPFRWRDLWRAVKSSPWTWIGLTLLLCLVGWWIWRRYFRRKPAEELIPEIILPPHEQAVRDLIALREKRYPARGMLKEFFSEYSQVMRAYLERRYEFPALEMTTFDLERELLGERFPDIISRNLMPTFHEADLVKFAKYVPPLEMCDRVLEIGFEIVASTKPQEVVPEEVKAA